MSERLTPLIYVTITDGKGNRQRVTEQTYRIAKLEYTDSVKQADKCEITVLNDDLSNWDDPVWFHGNFVQVSWGYPGNMALTRELIITKVKGFTELKVEARAKSVLIDAVKKSRTFRNMTRSEIVRQIAREYGYDDSTTLLDDSGAKLAHVTQAGLSDAQFIRKLASQQGYEFYVDQEGLHFHEQKLAQDAGRTFTWFTDQTRGDVLSISVESEKTRKAAAVKSKGIDPVTKEEKTVEADNKKDEREGLAVVFFHDPLLLGGEYVVQDTTRKLTAAEKFILPEPSNMTSATNPEGKLDKSLFFDRPDYVVPNMMMKGRFGERPEYLYRPEEVHPMMCIGDGGKSETSKKFRDAQRGALKITLNAIGDPTLLAKSVVRLEGVGKRLTGNYFVHEVKHSVEPGGYTMSVKLRSDGFNADGKDVAKKAGRESGIPEVAGEKSAAKRKDYKPPSGLLHDKDALEPYTIVDKNGKPVMLGYRPKHASAVTVSLTTYDREKKTALKISKGPSYIFDKPAADATAPAPTMTPKRETRVNYFELPSNQQPAKKDKS